MVDYLSVSFILTESTIPKVMNTLKHLSFPPTSATSLVLTLCDTFWHMFWFFRFIIMLPKKSVQVKSLYFFHQYSADSLIRTYLFIVYVGLDSLGEKQAWWPRIRHRHKADVVLWSFIVAQKEMFFHTLVNIKVN